MITRSIFIFKDSNTGNTFHAGVKCSDCLATIRYDKFTDISYEDDNLIRDFELSKLAKYYVSRCPKCNTYLNPTHNYEVFR